jgi:hypothetical protein
VLRASGNEILAVIAWKPLSDLHFTVVAAPLLQLLVVFGRTLRERPHEFGIVSLTRHPSTAL